MGTKDSLHPTAGILEAFLELPPPVAGALAERWWDWNGHERSSVAFFTEDGVEVDWRAVLGEALEPFRARLEEWMRAREEERLEAWLWRKGGNAKLVYRALRQGRTSWEEATLEQLYREDLPEPPPPPRSLWRVERPLEERVGYALGRYRTFWHREAPKDFREDYPEAPTLEGVVAMNRLKGWTYWHPAEEKAAKAFLREHLEKG